jgi:hypothetical protein
VERGEELGRLYLRSEDEELVDRIASCFLVEEHGEAPPLVHGRVGPDGPSST